MNVKAIRAAAAELAERVAVGESYAHVEVDVMIKHDIPDEDFNRVLEVYATEMVDDEG